MNNKFFTFLNPVLAFIDNGAFFRKPFRWLYKLLAVINLIFPIAVLVVAIDSGLFRFGGKVIITFLLLFLILCALGWFGFQIWWNRSDKVNVSTGENDDFVAIPVFSHFLQTCGEWLGMFIGVGGCCISLVVLVFLGSDAQSIGQMLNLGMLVGGSFLSVLLYPVYGFLIVVGARVLAELYRALAAIANNTRK